MATRSCTANTASNSGWNATNEEELRIVLMGKTGCGRSATGNTILGRKYFESKRSATSLTVNCSKGRAEVDGQKVAVIDTPGLFDTRFDKDGTDQHLSQCISLTAPGPHVFLVIISLLDRNTQEEKQTLQKIQEFFGEAADKYSMVLFTHGDQLEDMSIEEFLEECPELQELVARCNRQYHVFNNRELEDRSQVIELLQKIKEICKKNPGSYYSNEMFQQAERAVEEKKQRILRENEVQRRREKEELEKEVKEKYEMLLKRGSENAESVNKIQEERERELMKETRGLQERHETEARVRAEESNPFCFLRRACEKIAEGATEIGKAFGIMSSEWSKSQAAV